MAKWVYDEGMCQECGSLVRIPHISNSHHEENARKLERIVDLLKHRSRWRNYRVNPLDAQLIQDISKILGVQPWR